MTDQGFADLDRPVRIELTSKSIKLVTVTGAIMAVAGAAVAVANWHIDGSEKTEIGVVVAVVGVVVFLGARISAWWDTAKNPQNIFRSGGHAIGSLRPCVR